MRRALVLAAAALLAAWGSPAPRDAFAQAGSTDYVVTTPATGLYETPPATATVLSISSQSVGVQVTLPFKFAYWGAPVPVLFVTKCGYVCLGVSTGQGLTSGRATNGLLADITQANLWDGMCAPHWDNLDFGSVHVWTAGATPNRRFIVSWENFRTSSSSAEHLHFQARFFEDTHKIQFAYKPDAAPSEWVQNSYNCGLVAPGSDTRWTAATTDSNLQTGHPPTDYEFSPRVVHCTGRVLNDRPVPTSSGLPSAPTADVPLADVRVELRHGDGTVLGSTTTAADGSYDVAATYAASGTGEVWLSTLSTACVVRNASGTGPQTFRVATGVPLSAGAALGTTQLTAANDPAYAFRARAAIVGAIRRVYAWAAPKTLDPIPQLPVDYGETSTAVTEYQTSSAPLIRIAGPAAANPDAWDEPVVMRVYARHVMAWISVTPFRAYDDRFDTFTDPENAFANAFACWTWASVTGRSVFVDAVDATTATSIDLEDPKPSTAKAASVAAWDAAALYDLLDGANEAWDAVDGTGPEALRPFQVVDALEDDPTIDRFYRQWSLQRDALELSRVLIHHGLVPEDAHEPNDSAAQATPLGALGAVRGDGTLQIHNEDWYEATASGDVADLLVEIDYPPFETLRVVLLEALDGAGNVLASKTETKGSGPITLDLGARPAGVYRARVRHVEGVAIPAYTVQIAERIALSQRPLRDWTQDRPYAEDLPLTGGVRPYDVRIDPPTAGVPGVAFDAGTLTLEGTPFLAGTFDFSVTVQDGGAPGHYAASVQHVVIHPPVDLPMGEFLGVQADKPVAFALPRTGGTPPFASSMDAGAPPAGLAFDGAAFRIVGSATAPGSGKATFSTIDTAGSAATRATTIVACAAAAGSKTPVDLAAGDAACGLYVDAVQGASLAFSVSTAKGSPKRRLRAAVVGGDGRAVAGGVAKTGVGKASLALAAPFSGRFFFVAASADGEPAHLTGGVAARPATKGAGERKFVAPGTTLDVEVGALAGATLTFSAKPDRKSGLALEVVELIDPDGVSVPLDGLAKTKNGAASLAATLGLSGTWTIRFRGTDAFGGAKWSYRLKQPKGVVYSAD